jgi:tRNA threonylcarbamoyladenosine biosynthesis protein TsaE
MSDAQNPPARQSDANAAGPRIPGARRPAARWIVEVASEAETTRLGQALAAALPASAVIALHGPLGAGKTRLVQAAAEAAGVERGDVVSPTFVLIQEHFGRGPIYHIDAYRLSGAEEFRQLGGDEYLAGPGWTFVEWADRIPECLPEEMLAITLEPLEDDRRRIEFAAFGQTLASALALLAEKSGLPGAPATARLDGGDGGDPLG